MQSLMIKGSLPRRALELTIDWTELASKMRENIMYWDVTEVKPQEHLTMANGY